MENTLHLAAGTWDDDDVGTVRSLHVFKVSQQTAPVILYSAPRCEQMTHGACSFALFNGFF